MASETPSTARMGVGARRKRLPERAKCFCRSRTSNKGEVLALIQPPRPRDSNGRTAAHRPHKAVAALRGSGQRRRGIAARNGSRAARRPAVAVSPQLKQGAPVDGGYPGKLPTTVGYKDGA